MLTFSPTCSLASVPKHSQLRCEPSLRRQHAISTQRVNADTGSTGNYVLFRDADVLLDFKPTLIPLTVTLPDGTVVTSTHTATLRLPQLPLGARHVDIFPDFIGSLLSTGVLCDHVLTAV